MESMLISTLPRAAIADRATMSLRKTPGASQTPTV
jgi:hypothetical protein